MIDVDAKDLSQKLVYVLRAIARVISRAAVPGAYVQKAVVSEFEHPAVMICERLIDRQKYDLTCFRFVRICRRRPVLGDHSRAVRTTSVVYKEASI